MIQQSQSFMKLLILTFFLLTFNVQAFDCHDSVGKKFWTPGNADFQYQYLFNKDRSVDLNIFMISHDDIKKEGDQHKLEKVFYKGRYAVTKNSLTVFIRVEDVNHKMIFSCEDKQLYMNSGPRSKSLKVGVTVPKNHGFSLFDLWPAESKVIRSDFSKHE